MVNAELRVRGVLSLPTKPVAGRHCSFGVFGAVPLLVARRLIQRLERSTVVGGPRCPGADGAGRSGSGEE